MLLHALVAGFYLFHGPPFFFLSLRVPYASDICPLSLHDALPILLLGSSTGRDGIGGASVLASAGFEEGSDVDRTSTRLNSSHVGVSYAVVFFKKNNDDLTA